MRRDVPEPWAGAMIRAGYTDPRNNERPSMRQLADKVGVHTTTISTLVWGERDTDTRTLEKVAEALRLPVTTVSEWAGRARTVEDPYEPPTVASLMSADQRRLVSDLIRQLTAHATAKAAGDQEARQTVEQEAGVPKLRSRKILERELTRARRSLVEAENAGLTTVATSIRESIGRLETELNTPEGRSQGRRTEAG